MAELGGTDAATLRHAALQALAAGAVGDAARLIEEYTRLRPDDGVMLYNGACAHCLLGDHARAEQLLLDAVKAGFMNFSQMRRDRDLHGLRDRPAYRALMAARDAADPILADRQIERWRQGPHGASYRFGEDETRRLRYVVGRADIDPAALEAHVAGIVDELTATLFGAPPRHTLVVAIPHADDAMGHFADPHIKGSYKHVGRSLIATDTGRSLRHELVHALHHSHMDRLGQTHPMWIQEGLASFYERRGLAGDAAEAATERDLIARDLARGGGLPTWSELFASDRRDFRVAPAARYAAAHAVVSFLDAHDRVHPWYEAYCRTHDEDPSGARAIEEVFDEPVAAIELEWRRWCAERVIDVAMVEAPDRAMAGVAPRTPDPKAAWRRWEAQALFEDTRSLSSAGRYDEVIPALQSVVTLAPDHAGAHYALGLAFVRTNDLPAARRQCEILAELDPSLRSLLDNLVLATP
ncbi:MAG: hypothetical protein HKO59_13270 [Phycisphaerales bacterium]|nr:hypothetical protein [Phycisphaerales bacterium]